MAGTERYLESYEGALRLYFRHEEEKALFAASELAKDMIRSGLGPDDLMDIHSTALRLIVSDENPMNMGQMVLAANDLLLHAVMAFAMTYHSLLSKVDAEKKMIENAYAELRKANARLKELDHLKSVFVATVSHELRTPLNSVIGFSSILLNEWIGPVTPEQTEKLEIILRSGRHLLSRINDIINVSEIETGMITPVIEEFDLYDLIEEAVSTISKEAEEKGLKIKVEGLNKRLHTDRRRLLQSILYLLGNAVKFTEKGTISLVTGCSSGGDLVDITVTDSGIGIREEDIPKLFEPFCRLDFPVTVPGTGLGLYLTKKLVTEVLKGKVACHSVFGQGSSFSIIIPVDSAKGTAREDGEV